MGNDWEKINAACVEMGQQRHDMAKLIVTQMHERWRLETLAVLAEAGGPLRFSRVMENVKGISQKSLTKTLRQLERDGLATRKLFPEVPPRVEYAITELGLEMLDQVYPMWVWVVTHLEQFEKARSRYDKKR